MTKLQKSSNRNIKNILKATTLGLQDQDDIELQVTKWQATLALEQWKMLIVWRCVLDLPKNIWLKIPVRTPGS